MKRWFQRLTFKIGSMIILVEIIVLALFGYFYIQRISTVLDEKDTAAVLQIGPYGKADDIKPDDLVDEQQYDPDDTNPPPVIDRKNAQILVLSPDGATLSAYPSQAVDALIPDLNLIDFENLRENIVHIQEGNDYFVIGVRPVYNDDGTLNSFVYVKLNTNSTEETKAELRQALVVGSVATIVLTSLILFLGLRFTILKRIKHVLGVLQRIEAGDLTARANGGNHFPDEMDALQHGVDSTASRLETLFNTLEQQVADRTRDVKVAADVSRHIATILNLDDLLQQIVAQVNAYFDDCEARVFLLEGDRLVCTSQSGANSADITRIAAQAAKTGEAVIINNDVLSDIRSEAAFPIIQGTKLLGVFDVQSKQPDYFGEEEISILRALAEQMATAIHNAQSFTEIESARQFAEAANRAKSLFLANMSHELRTPLNAILGFSQLMAGDSTLSAGHRENLAVINRSGEHLLRLINDVLEVSKIEAGRVDLNITAFDLYLMLANLEEMLRIRAEHKGLQFHIEIQPDTPQYIRTDENKLRQVLINLIGNAIKFTEEGGVTVRIGCEAPSHLKFEVEDTGCGIPKEDAERVFEIFARSGTKTQEGTGLGLPLSRQYVRLMGGDLTVQSVDGRGSLFCFNIQVELTDSSELQHAPAERHVTGLVPGQETRRILIVEDKLENRMLLQKLLEPIGFEIREAVNGQEGVDLCESWNPHLIFMDMRMPVMDGYEATQRIKAKRQDVTIIALTASSFEHERARILSIGCDDFLRKPFRQSDLFKKLEQHLGVQFVYDEPAVSVPALTDTLTRDDLVGLPSAWRKSLSQAAAAARLNESLTLINQIRPNHEAVANGLTDLVNTFRFSSIVRLIGE